MKLFQSSPLPEAELAPFLHYWPGEIVRHLGRLKEGDVALTGCVVDSGRNFVSIKWENDPSHLEVFTDPAALVKIIKQTRPDLAQL